MSAPPANVGLEVHLEEFEHLEGLELWNAAIVSIPGLPPWCRVCDRCAEGHRADCPVAAAVGLASSDRSPA